MSDKKLSYKEAFGELEAILAKLESHDTDVDQLENLVKRASELIRICRKKLFDTEKEVEKIIGELESEDQD